MELPVRGSGIPQPASEGGPLLELSSLPSASTGGDTSLLGHDNETSDANTLQHFASDSVGDAPDPLPPRSSPPTQPGTPGEAGSGEVYRGKLSPNNPWLQPMASQMEAPAEVPVASPSFSHHGGGDSGQQPAADNQLGASVSHRRIRDTQENIRYGEQGRMNRSLLNTNPPSRGCRSSAQGRSLQNSIGNSTDNQDSRHAESGVEELDAFPCSGGASYDGVGFDPTEGSQCSCDPPIRGLPISSGSVRPLTNVSLNTTQGAEQSATSSSSCSIPRGSTPMALSGGYLLNRQDHRPSLLRRQRPPTSAAMSSSARQTAIQHGRLRGDFQLLSLEERYRDLREDRGAVGGLPPRSSQRGAQGCRLPSTSSGRSLVPFGHPTRAGHGHRHFRVPRPNISVPASSFAQPRPPFTPPPYLVTRRPPRRYLPPTSLRDGHRNPWAGSMFPPHPPDTESSESSEDEDADDPDDWYHVFRRFRRMMRRGLRRADINKLPSYPFDPEQHGQIFCSVCRSEIESQELVRVLPCKHQFHATSCIDKWLRMNRTCPNCRLDVSAAAKSAPQST